MICTETVALTKVCHRMIQWDRETVDDKGLKVDQANADVVYQPCIGSLCMAWAAHDTFVGKGFCGLVYK